MRSLNWQALILGLVQGATELLPISSSGHLILVPWFGGWEYLEEHDAFNQTFDVSLHLGTLIAVVVYFCARLCPPRGRRSSAHAADAAGSRPPRSGRVVRRRLRRSRPRSSAAVGEDLIAENLGEPWQIAIAAGRVRGLFL